MYWKKFLKGKTVLIGLDLKANPDVQGGKTDTFPTPYTRLILEFHLE